MRKRFLLLGFVIFLGSCIDNQPWKAAEKTTEDTSQDLVSKKDVSKDIVLDTIDCDDEGQCVESCDPMECEPSLCVNGACVQCVEDKDCPDIDAARCDADNFCVGCTSPIQCERFNGVARCEEGICQCGSNDDCESGEVCDTRTSNVGNCRIPGTKNSCEACIDDNECATGYCVGLNFMEEPDGMFCVDEAVGICSGPYVENDRLSTTGGLKLTFCTPNPSRTTCDAILVHASAGTCPNGDIECSEGGFCTNARCTYSCENDQECPGNCIVDNTMGTFGYCE